MVDLKKLSYAECVRQAIKESMEEDQNVICFGLGVTDPKGIFGTTPGSRHSHFNHFLFVRYKRPARMERVKSTQKQRL